MTPLPLLISPGGVIAGGVRLRDGKVYPSPLPPSGTLRGFSPLPTAPGEGVIAVAGLRGTRLMRLDGEGRILWELPLPGDAHILPGRMAPDGYLAVGGRWWVSPEGEVLEDPILQAELRGVGPGRLVMVPGGVALAPAEDGHLTAMSFPYEEIMAVWDGRRALVALEGILRLREGSGPPRTILQGRSVLVLPDGTWAVAVAGTVRTGRWGEVDPRPGPEGIPVEEVLGGNLTPDGGWAFWVEGPKGHFLLFWPPDGGAVRAIEIPAHREWSGGADVGVRLLGGGRTAGQHRVWLIPASGTDRPASIPGKEGLVLQAAPWGVLAEVDRRIWWIAPGGADARPVEGLPAVTAPSLLPLPEGVVVIGERMEGGKWGMGAWLVRPVPHGATAAPLVPHRPGQAVRGAALPDGRAVLEVEERDEKDATKGLRLLLLSPDGSVEGAGALPAGLPRVWHRSGGEVPGGRAAVLPRTLLLAPDGGPVIPAAPMGRPGIPSQTPHRPGRSGR